MAFWRTETSQPFTCDAPSACLPKSPHTLTHTHREREKEREREREREIKRSLADTYKVAVKTVAGGVTIREDERLRIPVPHILEPIDGPGDLVEEGHGAIGEASRTFSSVDYIRIDDVGLVVRRVQIDSVPARREEDLRTKATRTVVIGQTRRLLLILAQASEIDGLFRYGSAVLAASGISGEHAEPLGEWH